MYPIACDPGNYCIAGSAAQTICPPGFYCRGSEEIMYKCEFGTYCPEGSAFEIACPGGTYGSGNPKNYDEKSACIACGRGLYSVMNGDSPKDQRCLDCTAGFVCKGKTSTPEPINISADGGYECTLGHYCPTGSFDELMCPVGTYAKYMGRKTIDDCIKCKVDFYQDEPGQKGCKRCGPTANAAGGATTCACNGIGRNFRKSIGACTCGQGFQPKNN